MDATADRFATADERRVEVFVRSMLPPLGAKSRQEALIARLDELAAASALDGVSVTVTGNRLCLCDTCSGTDGGGDLIDRIAELDEWGDEYDATASPFFETRELDSSIAGETARALVPPRVSAALYCDEALAGVFPCRIGGREYTVADLVDALDRFAGERQLVVEP
ncbi:HTH domain-containing protein [Halosimplex halophilum]|uniref:HTH domain-containing protein n=1 Tax=Halosimplex halophilum TaxID=2559572 RepID=UPI00107F9DCB|nr:HTH domain-containing protein [Halosimplex halophilum]